MSKKAEEAGISKEEIVGIFSGLDSKGIQVLLEERAKRAALSFGLELLEQDVESLCGARYSRSSEYSRYGKEQTSIIIGGSRYALSRPRIRGKEGEVYPETLTKLRKQDLLDEEMQQRLLLGVSTRSYGDVIEGYSDKIGVSKSSVSRAFQRASKKDLDCINYSDLSEYSFVGLMIDGIEISGRTVIAVIGITSELQKIPLGLIEGDTENSEVVTELLSNLVERNFSLHCNSLLCVLDGSKALRKGIKSVFGDRALIQRCWIHKLRNLKAHLPKEYHGTLLWRMKRLMGLKSYSDAKKELASLRKWLSGISDSALRSLDDSGEELITLHKLRVTGELRKSLSTTNPIESLFSVVRAKLRNVKNFKSRKTNQAMRWIASAILQHQKQKMRALRGIKQKQILINALGIKKTLDNKKFSV